MNFRNSKFALLLGAINGVIFYLAYQPVKIAYVKYLWYIKNDDYIGVALPEIYQIARDVGEIFVWTLLFMLASYTVHRFWAAKLESTVTLWLRVAVLSLAVPIVGLWGFRLLLGLFMLALRQLDLCFSPLNCHSPTEELIPLLVRGLVDIKFELLLFVVALAVNFVYGATIAKLSKHFAK